MLIAEPGGMALCWQANLYSNPYQCSWQLGNDHKEPIENTRCQMIFLYAVAGLCLTESEVVKVKKVTKMTKILQ